MRSPSPVGAPVAAAESKLGGRLVGGRLDFHREAVAVRGAVDAVGARSDTHVSFRL